MRVTPVASAPVDITVAYKRYEVGQYDLKCLVIVVNGKCYVIGNYFQLKSRSFK